MENLPKDPFLEALLKNHATVTMENSAFTEQLVSRIAKAQRKTAFRKLAFYTVIAVLIAELLLWFLFPIVSGNSTLPDPTMPENAALILLWLLEWIGKVATHPGFIAMIFLGLAGLTASQSYPENPTYENRSF